MCVHAHNIYEVHYVHMYILISMCVYNYICYIIIIMTEPSLNAKLWKTCGKDFKKICHNQPEYTIIRCLSSAEDVRMTINKTPILIFILMLG